VTPVPVDVLDSETLNHACQGMDTIYYLVHSMYGKGDFTKSDRTAATNMVSASKKADVVRIIYLSGLGDDMDSLSTHLRSRREVRSILACCSTPVTTLRAAMIIGSGSASFEIMRYLVNRLPLMTTPTWVRTRSQPIAISNALGYLVDVLKDDRTIGESYDIGGPEILRYQDIMNIYTEEAGLLKRLIIPIPILSPRFSSYWVNLVTPVPASIARPLVEGLRNETICKNNEIREIVPQQLISIRDSIRLVLDEHVASQKAEFVPEWTQPNDPPWSGDRNRILPKNFPIVRI